MLEKLLLEPIPIMKSVVFIAPCSKSKRNYRCGYTPPLFGQRERRSLSRPAAGGRRPDACRDKGKQQPAPANSASPGGGRDGGRTATRGSACQTESEDAFGNLRWEIMLFSERPKVTCRGGSPNGARTESNGSVRPWWAWCDKVLCLRAEIIQDDTLPSQAKCTLQQS
jgi:hypothetical protein